MLKTYKIARKVNVNQDHSVSAYIQTMIKHVFLFNYPHELFDNFKEIGANVYEILVSKSLNVNAVCGCCGFG